MPRARWRFVHPGLEALMYLAFSAGALPLAWFGINELLYYQAHPEQVETRDAAPLVLAVMAAIQISEIALGVALILTLYFLIKGPRAVRCTSSALVLAWILPFFLVPSTPFASFARLYWDSLPWLALCLLPWICAGIRLARRRRDEAPAT